MVPPARIELAAHGLGIPSGSNLKEYKVKAKNF